MAIVTTAYRYKRPPRKRKAIALEAPAVVTTKNSRRPVLGETAAEVQRAPVQEGTAQSSTPREAARVISPSHHSASPANDDRKPAIVTIKRKSRFGDAPELTPEEHQRRGEAADAMWRGLVDQATAKDGKSAAVSAESSFPRRSRRSSPRPAGSDASGTVRSRRWSCRCLANRSSATAR
jgi:hypothetical protein